MRKVGTGWEPNPFYEKLTLPGNSHKPTSDQSGAKGSRTPDLLNAIQTRYQLRHSPSGAHYSKFAWVFQAKLKYQSLSFFRTTALWEHWFFSSGLSSAIDLPLFR